MSHFLQKPNPPASSDQLERLAKSVPGIAQSYIDFLRHFNGGYSPDAVVVTPDGGTSILKFLGIELGAMSSISDWQAGLPKELLPVVRDGAGNLFCLATEGSDQGAIYFWDHDTQEAEKCASSWVEFVSGIHIDE